jgi:hypothetical protein
VFTREDVGAVADLWVRAYRQRASPAPASLRCYFEKIYFGSPWQDPELPSWVCEGDGGAIHGFVALFARPLSFAGRRIKVAVLSTIMVDPRERGRSLGLRLMQQAFAGPQDLIFTDGANDACRRLWLAAGGEVCTLLCCDWLRTLRPAAHALALAARRRALLPAVTALRPLAPALDALAVRAPLGPQRLPRSGARGEEAGARELLACRAELGGQAALSPVYEVDDLGWLLDATAEATARGRLERIVVRDAGGRALGWYVYFAKRGGLCEVMQLGGAPGTMRQVLLQLFERAWSQGGVALRGRVEPRFVPELVDAHCGFTFQLSVLAHARDPAILRALHAGDTSLSRLDGEWWMHFADGPWS